MPPTPSSTPTLRVGVVGAGPWAMFVHAPMFAVHPRTELTAVWSRRLGAAEEVATPLGAVAHDSFDHFLDADDAVSFAVPPDVQADLAVTAARAGKVVAEMQRIATEAGMNVCPPPRFWPTRSAGPGSRPNWCSPGGTARTSAPCCPPSRRPG